jgi:hypothetical protein
MIENVANELAEAGFDLTQIHPVLEPFATALSQIGLFRPVEQTVDGATLLHRIDPYVSQHFEAHLQKVAASLDRCMSFRDEWERLRTEAALLCLELDETLRIYFLSKNEIDSGLWDIPAVEVKFSLESLRVYGQRLQEALFALDERAELYVAQALTDETDFRVQSAVNSGQPMYVQQGDTERDWPALDGTGLRHTKRKWIELDAVVSARRDLLIERVSFASERARLLGEIERNEKLIAAAENRDARSQDEKAARIRKLEAAHATAMRKLALSQAVNSPLNYEARARRIAQHIALDLQSLRSHCLAVELGMTAVFGFRQASLSGNPSIDELYSFLHTAIEFISEVESREIVAASRISLKERMGSASFQAFQRGSTEVFEIRETDFAGSFSTRLVGLSVVSVGSDLATGLKIESPKEARYVHPDGAVGFIKDVGAEVRFQCCYEDLPGRRHESAGFPILQSAGPIGRWTATLPAANQAFDDLFIELTTRSLV